jgi:phage terminase small subunit
LKLTDKQKIFCDEYIISLNATQAAIKAGYAEKTAYAIGAENLKKPKIQSYISERMKQKESSLIATQDEVLQYLTSVLRGESQTTDIVLVGIGDGWQEVQEVEKKPSEKDRLKAAELLGKRYGLYTDKVSADVDMSLDISIDYGDGDED